jgi:hypothetical protein
MLVHRPGPKDVSGATDGYEPTNAFVKVFVKGEGANQTLVDFDRRDWYAAGIVQKLDDRSITFVDVHGQERAILGEVVVESARSPAALAALKYEAMHATEEQRSAMDLEYEQILKRITAPTIVSPSPPTSSISLP